MRGSAVKKWEDRTKQKEGFSGIPYVDVTGHVTVGYGFNLTDSPLTIEESDFILKCRRKRAVAGAISIFGKETYRKFGSVRQGAISELIYILGEHGFRGFKKTISFINNDMWKLAGREILVNTAGTGKSDLYIEIKSRAEEISEMLITGKYI